MRKVIFTIQLDDVDDNDFNITESEAEELLEQMKGTLYHNGYSIGLAKIEFE